MTCGPVCSYLAAGDTVRYVRSFSSHFTDLLAFGYARLGNKRAMAL